MLLYSVVYEVIRGGLSSAHLLALLADAQSHTLCFGAQADQARDTDLGRFAWSRGHLGGLLNRHVDEAVLLELRLGVEVGDQEARLLIRLRNLRHQLDVQTLCEVLHVLLEVHDGRVHLHLVLPVVVCPLLLELELGAIGRHQSIDEIDLNLVDVDDIWDVATCRVEGKVSVDRTVVGRADLERTLDDLRFPSTQGERDWLLNDLQVALC